MERPQAEPVAERPLHATEDSHNRGSEEGPAPSKRSQLPLTKHRLLINNWIRDSPITGVRTDLQSQRGDRREEPALEASIPQGLCRLPATRRLQHHDR